MGGLAAAAGAAVTSNSRTSPERMVAILPGPSIIRRRSAACQPACPIPGRMGFVDQSDVCVIYNPTAGRGRARRRLESLRCTLGPRADFRPTQGPGHAVELAAQAARDGF